MSNKNDKKLFDLLNTVQGRVVGILALVGALIGGYKLCSENPTFFAYTMIGVIVCLLWLKLFFIRTSKRLKSTIPKKVYESPYTPRQLRAALTGLVALPLLVGMYAAYQLYIHQPQKTNFQCPPFTVALAEFTPASEDQKGIAQGVTNNFRSDLGHYKDDIKENPLGAKINYATSPSQVLKDFGHLAHLVIYGEVRQVQPIIAVRVYVCRSNRCHDPDGLTVEPLPFEPIIPETLEFNPKSEGSDEMSKELTSIALCVVGIGLYERHELEQARSRLTGLTLPEAHFYLGLIDEELFQEKQDGQLLKNALDEFETILNDGCVLPPCPDIKAHAKTNAGNICLMLAQFDTAKAYYFDKAKAYYTDALNDYEKVRSHEGKDAEGLQQAWGAAKSNLAVAMIQQAKTQGPQQMVEAFRQAENALLDVQDQCPYDTYPFEWITATSNLASLWGYDQSPMAEDPKGKLRQAIEAFEEALALIRQRRASQENSDLRYKQAQILASLGGLYSNEALETEMQLDKANAYYVEAGTVFTSDKYPADWGQNQNELGLVLIKQSRVQQNKQEAVKLLDDAIQRFTDAKVYLPEADWALTTAYLADASREKGKKIEDQNMKCGLLQTALDFSEQAMTQMQSEPACCSALDLAMAQQILGDSYYEKGLLGGNDKNRRLGKAREAYDAARKTWDQYHYAFHQRTVQARLRKVQEAFKAAKALLTCSP